MNLPKIPPFTPTVQRWRIVSDHQLASEIQQRWHDLGYLKAKVWIQDGAIRSNLVRGIPPR